MSDNEKPRKPKALDYCKATVLSIMIFAAVFYSHKYLTIKYDYLLPDIYPHENVVGTWNDDAGKSSVDFDANGFCQLKDAKKKMLFIKTEANNFTLFKFGRDKKGNRLGTIAHKVKVLGETKLELDKNSYTKLVAQK
ncbi:hypothetical protein PQO01_10325 [Lentisphaera marina]|uniref:hypothetical protein n=1 Tax=Lentisphaera marina TaxID=1111041 RepID=UPI002365950C|nr:hypothetical protein [Lentisphaera marina]MDD7985348.1 hypothetical protein [Lentisphaera marina]